MATPDERRKRTWRFRLNDTTTLEVSAKGPATERQIRRRGRIGLILGTLFAAVMLAAVAYAADIQTDAVLGTSVPTATQVSIGNNSFQIKVWATGNINNPSATGQAEVVNKYFMATNGTITPSASAADKTTLSFTTNVNYSQSPPCGITQDASIQGCPNNPFVVNAALVVATGTPDDTTGTLTVSNTGSAGLNADSVPDTGVVQVDAPPANTAPTVTVTGVTNGFSYEIGSVPAAGCSVVDTEDGNSTPAATLSAITGANADYGIGSQTASCSYTDGGGITRNASATYSIVDTGNPTITFVSRTTANVNGWNNTDVTVNWSCSDSGSGVLSATETKIVSTEGSNQSATGTCTDHAGNTATDTRTGINIDKTAPSVAYTSASPSPNTAGWNNTDVVATFTATDTLSGFAGPSTTKTGTSTTSSEGLAVTVGSPAFTDLAGNTAPADTATSDAFMIDKTNPIVSVTGVSNGATYTLGSVPAAGCSTSDSLSGVKTNASLVVSGGTVNGVGSFTATCSGGSDNAGNLANASATYQVNYGGLSGILQPINSDNSSVFSRGKAVPVKFQLAGDEYTGFNFSAWKLNPQQTSCTIDGNPVDGELEPVVENPSNGFRYDAAADQYIYNANFKSMAVGTCWKVVVTLDSGQKLSSAVFKLQK